MTKYAFVTLFLSLSFTPKTNALTLADNNTTIKLVDFQTNQLILKPLILM